MDILFNFSKKNKGFLMIDAIVAVVIVTVALVALSYLYTQGTKAGIMAGSSERAMEIGAQRIEFLKKGAGVGYSADDGLAVLVTAANSDKVVKLDGDNREYLVESSANLAQVSDTDNNNYGRDKLYKIVVTVSWTGPAAESVRLESYIAVE
ncbi:hypothetical protein SDC9_51336 [bioreactor metagenome]|uniref:Type 4 fimbrial biogenesis protein PilX N-terminal domain-containing protein n=1 Tax=bioreactor metagenome TaxID=1076179 RepID=A0A644WS39_9ZZZZ|nr:hypothetical protein [Acidaminococcaceae bacterium]